jgi:hypothetical protein
VGWESWFGFMEGGSRVELEVMLTQPRERGATGETMTVPNCLSGSEAPKRTLVAPISYLRGSKS